MKQQLKFWIIGLVIVNLLAVTSCDDYDDDDNNVQPAVTEKTYTLDPLSNSGVSGTVTFRKQNDQTMIIVQLFGTVAGNSHPAHIHSGSAGSGGPIVLDFNPVDGATGHSETSVTALNDGTAVTYEELIAFNGHVNVHLSAAELQVMIAQGNIGSNSQGSSNPDGGADGY
jgi:hypothetical protein